MKIKVNKKMRKKDNESETESEAGSEIERARARAREILVKKKKKKSPQKIQSPHSSNDEINELEKSLEYELIVDNDNDNDVDIIDIDEDESELQNFDPQSPLSPIAHHLTEKQQQLIHKLVTTPPTVHEKYPQLDNATDIMDISNESPPSTKPSKSKPKKNKY